MEFMKICSRVSGDIGVTKCTSEPHQRCRSRFNYSKCRFLLIPKPMEYTGMVLGKLDHLPAIVKNACFTCALSLSRGMWMQRCAIRIIAIDTLFMILHTEARCVPMMSPIMRKKRHWPPTTKTCTAAPRAAQMVPVGPQGLARSPHLEQSLSATESACGNPRHWMSPRGLSYQGLPAGQEG